MSVSLPSVAADLIFPVALKRQHPAWAIARVKLEDPEVVIPLAVAPEGETKSTTDGPQLTVPASLCGRYCLGFDEIQRTALLKARPSPVSLKLPERPPEDDPLGPLRRRWVATMLSGFASQRPTGTNSLDAELFLLSRSGLTTASALLDALSLGHSRMSLRQSIHTWQLPSICDDAAKSCRAYNARQAGTNGS